MADPRPMTEGELQSAVLDICALYGLHAFHPWISIGSKKGWPDLFIAGSSAIARELKNAARKPTPEQLAWGGWLRAAGIPWDVWRPADLRSGRIASELAAIR